MRDSFHNKKTENQFLSKSYNSSGFVFHNVSVVLEHLNTAAFQRLELPTVPWKLIDHEIDSKTAIDCRNMVIQLLKLSFGCSKPLQKNS